MIAAPAVHAAPCPSEANAAQLPVRPGDPGLRVDLDGDGQVDRVVIRYAPRSFARCAFFLVYELSGRKALASRLPPGDPQEARYIARDALREWHDPSLALVVRVRRGTLDTVVTMGHGASVSIDELFGVVGGRLRPLLSYDVGGFASGGTWSWGCAGDGRIAKRWVGPTKWNGKTYQSNGFAEWTYALRRGRYRSVAVRGDQTISAQRAEDLYRHWLFDDEVGFDNCAAKRP
jgi:hypothetical protein